jgi:SNF2 family DNA or RNA helicase
MPEMESRRIRIVRHGGENLFDDSQIYLISYELATKLSHQFMKRGIKFIIADEAHNLKSHTVNIDIEFNVSFSQREVSIWFLCYRK